MILLRIILLYAMYIYCKNRQNMDRVRDGDFPNMTGHKDYYFIFIRLVFFFYHLLSDDNKSHTGRCTITNAIACHSSKNKP